MSKGSFKFHWGHGIVLTFISFAAFMSYFYVNMSKEKIDLVGDHYYEDGQKFQEKIHILAETKQLATKIVTTFDAKDKVYVLKVPSKTSNLKVDFFFPGNAANDLHFQYPKVDSLVFIPTHKLVKGKWKVTISYQQLGKSYMEESVIRID